MAARVTGELYEGLTGQLFEIGRQLRQPNGYPFDPVRLQKHLQDAIEGRFATTSPSNIYPVHVNYDLSVEAATRAGHYDWKNSNITSSNFLSTRGGTADLDIILVHYDCAMEDKEIDKDLEGRGLRDAELPELLALAAKYPDLQLQFPIVARGSVWRNPHGERSVPFLDGSVGRRVLDLGWLVSRWSSDYRFAAVRK